MLSARAPRRYLKCPAPRPVKKLYEYTLEDSPNLEKIVIAIIHGTEMRLIDPQLYSQLIPIIKERIHDLKEWRTQPASKALEAALEYAENYRYENDPNQLVPYSTRSVRARSDKITQQDIEECLELALNRNDFDSIEPQMHEAMLVELKKMHEKSIQDGDYLLAEKIVNATRRVLSLLNENRYDEITIMKAAELQDKLYVKRNDCERLQEEWDQKISEVIRKRDQDIKRMERQHSRELRQFDQQFDSEPPPARRKYSPAYLQLRAQEAYMVSSKRYLDATKVREEANAMQKKETDEHRKSWLHELQLKRQELLKKQEDALYVRRQNCDLLVAKMKRQAEKEILQQEKAVSHIEHHCEMANSMLRVPLTNTRSIATTRSLRGKKRLPPLSGDIGVTDPHVFRQRAMINTIVYSKIGNA